MTGEGRIRHCLLIGLCCLLLLVACAVNNGDEAVGEATVSSPEALTASPTSSPIPATAVPTEQVSPTLTLPLPTVTPISTPTPTATATPQPLATPSPIPTSEVTAGWLVYHNDLYDFRFSYPPEAEIRPRADNDLSEEGDPGDICVSLSYKTGFVAFRVPWEPGDEYGDPCGTTGVGAYEVLDVSEIVMIDGHPYTADGTLVRERDGTADWHSEFYTVTLGDGAQIQYGSAIGTQEAFLEIKDTLLQIVTSFRSEATSLPIPTPTLIPPTVAATPRLVQVTPDPAAPECPRPDDLAQKTADFYFFPFFCIVWLDEFDDENGFRIYLDYPRSGEHFIYEVGPGVTQLIVPAADAPLLAESYEQCQRRRLFNVTIMALRDSEQQAGSATFITHCSQSRSTATSSPTATPE